MGKSNTSHFQRILTGFTLFEILLVIGVFMLFGSLSIAAYRSSQNEKKLGSDVQLFVTTLEGAKTKANAGEKACDDYTGSYTVTWNETSYIVTPNGCDAQSTTQLVSGNMFDSTGTVTFQANGLGATETCVEMTSLGSDSCASVSIETSGLIDASATNCTCP